MESTTVHLYSPLSATAEDWFAPLLSHTERFGENWNFFLLWALRIRNRRKRRQRSSLLFGGRILECRTSHLAARMIWRKVFGRTTILGGWWFGVVWTRWSSIFLKHPFLQVPVILVILFFKSSWCGMEWNSFFPSNSSDDLCLLFCLLLLPCYEQRALYVKTGANTIHFTKLLE